MIVKIKKDINWYSTQKNKDMLKTMPIWDVSECADFIVACSNYDFKNINLSKWDMRNAIDISQMFEECRNIEFSFEDWDLRNVLYANLIFEGTSGLSPIYLYMPKCESLWRAFYLNMDNKPIYLYVPKIENVNEMFDGCFYMNQPISLAIFSNSIYADCHSMKL